MNNVSDETAALIESWIAEADKYYDYKHQDAYSRQLSMLQKKLLHLY